MRIWEMVWEKTVYAIFRTLYEILCYPDALWTCLVVTRDRKKLQMQLNFEKRNLKS